MAGSDKAVTSAADTVAEPTRPEPETLVTTTERLTTSAMGTGGKSSQPEGLQVSGEAAAAVVKETSSSIDDMIKDQSQAGGSEIPMIEAGGASTSIGDVAEGSS